MADLQNEKGFVLICSKNGFICEIVKDDFNFLEKNHNNAPLTNIIDIDSRRKVFSFLSEVTEAKAAYGWEINVKIRDNVRTLFFAGAVHNEDILIVAATSHGSIFEYYDELMKINNEQFNMLRTEMKTKEELKRIAEVNHLTYNDLSVLNNELVTLQRELAKKNVELENMNVRLNNYSQEIAEQNKSLINKNKDLDEFAQIVSHDLKDPLTKISLVTAFLKRNKAVKSDEKMMEYFGILERSTYQMRDLINGILDYSRAGGKEEKSEEILLNELLAEVEDSLNLPDDAELEMIDNGIILSGIKIHLHQIFANLIKNAFKHNPDSNPKVIVEGKDKGEHILFSVKDNGQGIPESDRDRIFKMFQTMGVKKDSTGIGLAIVKKLIERNGGEIWIESAETGGADFKFTWMKFPAS